VQMCERVAALEAGFAWVLELGGGLVSVAKKLGTWVCAKLATYQQMSTLSVLLDNTCLFCFFSNLIYVSWASAICSLCLIDFNANLAPFQHCFGTIIA